MLVSFALLWSLVSWSAYSFIQVYNRNLFISSKLLAKKSENSLSQTKTDRNELIDDIDIEIFRDLLNERKSTAQRQHSNINNEIDDNQLKQSKILNSVIRVYCIHSSPNFAMPWQRNKQDYSSSTGFIISISSKIDNSSTKKYILTNAHAVEYGSLIQVKKRQSENKYVSSVVAIGHECDLAILTVDDPEFWQDLESLEFGNLPDLFEDVSVIGYPIGGDSVSITSGVVSRIEMQEYVQASAQLLAIQIDAAINPGNSGGPVFNKNNDVIGVAFQSLSSEETENIGYVIPVPVINHFIDDVVRHQKFSGICALGVRFQGMESNILRTYHGMSHIETGVMVAEVMPLSSASQKLMKNDIMLGIYDDQNLISNIDKSITSNNNKKPKTLSKRKIVNNNSNNSDSTLIKVANDGSIPFRESSNKIYKERVHLSYFFSQKFPNDDVKLHILRNRTRMDITLQLYVPTYLVQNTLVKNNFIDRKLNIGTGTNGSIVGGVPSYLVIGEY